MGRVNDITRYSNNIHKLRIVDCASLTGPLTSARATTARTTIARGYYTVFHKKDPLLFFYNSLK